MNTEEWITYLKTPIGRKIFPTGSILSFRVDEDTSKLYVTINYFIVRRRGRGVKLEKYNAQKVVE